MAAEAMTFLNIGRPSWDARVASHNSALLAQQRVRRRSMRTPECAFIKHIDNTRLVKASDPVRECEMRVFSVVATILLGLVLVYGLQHFYAIESGYNVESSKQQLEQLREENRQLKEELGLDHHEGRSWIGWHRHVLLVFMAYGYLSLLQMQEKKLLLTGKWKEWLKSRSILGREYFI